MFHPEAFVPALQRMAGILNQCGIRFQVTGGLAFVYYAEPRLTQDADLVVDPEQIRERLDDFLEAVAEMNYVASAATIRHAVAGGRMFQLLDAQECLKLDLYPREMVSGALDRSVEAELVTGVRLPIASRPDLIASKLVWISKGSHKSRRDVRQLMLRASEGEAGKVRGFAAGLGLAQLLEDVLTEADEIDA